MRGPEQLVCGRQNRVGLMHLVCAALLVHSNLSCESPGIREGLGVEKWTLETELREGISLAVRRHLERKGVGSSTTGKFCRGEPGHHRCKMPLFNDTQGAGPPLQTPSPPTSLCLHGHPSEQIFTTSSQDIIWPSRAHMLPLPGPPGESALEWPILRQEFANVGRG